MNKPTTKQIQITDSATLDSAIDATGAWVGNADVSQNPQTAAYTLALSDRGKHISITTGGITIPANSTVSFPVGSAVSIYNNSNTSQTIAITTDTLRLAGTANTGTLTLEEYGLATLLKVGGTLWVGSGAGLS